MGSTFHNLVVLFARKWSRIALTANKARYARGVTNCSPAAIVKFHADEHITRKYLFIALHTTSAFFNLSYRFGRNLNSEHIVFETHSLDAGLEVFLHLVLIARVRVKDIPFLRHGLFKPPNQTDSISQEGWGLLPSHRG